MLDYVAAHMREADVAEVLASSGLPPRDALETSVRLSLRVVAAIGSDGLPFLIFGCVPIDLLDGQGCVWALGTDAVNGHAREMLTHTPVWLDWFGQGYRTLRNRVDARNGRSVAWLRKLGFTFGPPVLSGHAGMMFLPFEREVPDVRRVF